MRPALLESLFDRTYRRLFAAQALSLVGTGLTTVALARLAYELAGKGCRLQHLCPRQYRNREDGQNRDLRDNSRSRILDMQSLRNIRLKSLAENWVEIAGQL